MRNPYSKCSIEELLVAAAVLDLQRMPNIGADEFRDTTMQRIWRQLQEWDAPAVDLAVLFRRVGFERFRLAEALSEAIPACGEQYATELRRENARTDLLALLATAARYLETEHCDVAAAVNRLFIRIGELRDGIANANAGKTGSRDREAREGSDGGGAGVTADP